MKKILFFLPLFVFGDILSDIENKTFLFKKEKSIQESKITKKSWLNPIMLQYTIVKDNNMAHKTTKTFSISINQPIFKSGAIYYSLKYAGDLKKLNLNNIEVSRRALIKKAYDLAYDYKITKLNKDILKLKIKNSLIDVKRKREEYENGTLDLTFLNNAIISLNSLKLSLSDIDEKLISLKLNFQNISDMDIEKVNLKNFNIISVDEYLNSNLELEEKKLSKKVNKDLYKMQIGDSLVTIFVNGSYSYQDIDYNTRPDDKNSFYSVGVGVSIPIDFSAKEKIEKAKFNYLVSNFDYLQKRRELINEYKSVISNIEIMKKKIKIYKDNIMLYNELINSTKNFILAGTATEDDLKILENSKKINLLQIEILKLSIQKELLGLYYKLKTFSN